MKHWMKKTFSVDSKVTTFSCEQCERMIVVDSDGLLKVVAKGEQDVEHSSGLYVETDVVELEPDRGGVH